MTLEKNNHSCQILLMTIDLEPEVAVGLVLCTAPACFSIFLLIYYRPYSS